MKSTIMNFVLLILAIGFINCNSTPGTKKPESTEKFVAEKGAYEKMELAFIGKPSETEIRPILEKVMKFHGLEINEKNRERSASCLITLRKSSKNRVTEMDILKHMNANGEIKLSFPDQAAISSTLLEVS